MARANMKPPATALGRMIREARIAKKWSQMTLGIEVEADQAAVSHWETGKMVPSPETVRKLKAALGIK